VLKLYYASPSRAIRPRWLLEEIGTPYELLRLDLAAGEQKSPEYLAINPNGTVPTLVDGDLTLFESAAICEHLADRFPEARLAPALGTRERALYYQWMHYAMSSVDAPLIAYLHHTALDPEDERIPAVAEASRTRLIEVAGILDCALTGKKHILGDGFSAADVMLGSGLIWAQTMQLIPPERREVRGYIERLGSRPAFQRASAD